MKRAMRSGVGYLLAAALLGVVGSSLVAMGRIEEGAAARQERLLTLAFSPSSDLPDLPELPPYIRRLPWVSRLDREAAERQAAAQYWLADYAALAGAVDTIETAGALDPPLLMIAAHAAFRRAPLDDAGAVKRLESILTLYAEVLKRDPAQFDAAYNFEFVVRRRNALAARRAPAAGRKPATPAPPPGRTLHGDPGEEPAGLEATEFKVIVPQPNDERQEQREAGSGTPVFDPKPNFREYSISVSWPARIAIRMAPTLLDLAITSATDSMP